MYLVFDHAQINSRALFFSGRATRTTCRYILSRKIKALSNVNIKIRVDYRVSTRAQAHSKTFFTEKTGREVFFSFSLKRLLHWSFCTLHEHVHN